MRSDDPPCTPTIVKVGGSLFDLPDFGPRLRRWLTAESSRALALVAGGGPTADVVRDLDTRHGLGAAAAHWLALQAMTLNAHFLAALLNDRRPTVCGDVTAWPRLWRQRQLPILDAYAFARVDERRADHLPHRWDVTSDSVAARVALVVGARRLVLLKSVSVSPETSWDEGARQGVVDPSFASIVAQASLDVVVVNLRE